MTDQPPSIRSVSLRLHCSVRAVTWAVVYRTQRGDAVFDRRVSSGMLEGARPLAGPEGVVLALEAALEDLRVRYGLPRREAVPGAPGGGGGRLGPSHAGLPSLVPPPEG